MKIGRPFHYNEGLSPVNESLGKERAAIVASITPATYQRYEHIRKAKIRRGVAVAEAAVGLGILIALFRNKETVLVDEIDLLKW